MNRPVVRAAVRSALSPGLFLVRAVTTILKVIGYLVAAFIVYHGVLGAIRGVERLLKLARFATSPLDFF